MMNSMEQAGLQRLVKLEVALGLNKILKLTHLIKKLSEANNTHLYTTHLPIYTSNDLGDMSNNKRSEYELS